MKLNNLATLTSNTAEWSAIALNLPEGLSFEAWVEVGSQLKTIEQSVMWWIGDWLRFGERRYGSKYEEAAAATGYSKSQLYDAKYVASAYDFSERSESLTWVHHRAAAPLPALQRKEALFLAVENGWSSRDLKAEIQRRKAEAASNPARPAAPWDAAPPYRPDAITRRLGVLVRAAFSDWFGIGEMRANLLATLFEAGGRPYDARLLTLAVDSHRPMTHGALHEAVHTLRDSFDSEAIDRSDDGYFLTEIGLQECRRALREAADMLLTAALEPANDTGAFTEPEPAA